MCRRQRRTYHTSAPGASGQVGSLSSSSNCTFVRNNHSSIYRLAHILATTSGRFKGGAHEGCRPLRPLPHLAAALGNTIYIGIQWQCKMQTSSHDWIITCTVLKTCLKVIMHLQGCRNIMHLQGCRKLLKLGGGLNIYYKDTFVWRVGCSPPWPRFLHLFYHIACVLLTEFWLPLRNPAAIDVATPANTAVLQPAASC